MAAAAVPHALHRETCRRRWRRLKLFEPTLLGHDGRQERAHLLNLSTGGALVHTRMALAPGTAIRLHVDERWVEARVGHSRGQYHGLVFARPLVRPL